MTVKKMIDTKKTLAQLCQIEWDGPEPDHTASFVVKQGYILLFEKRIKDFDPSDLRFLLQQNQNLDITIPMALEVLKERPFIEATYYPGDLLKSALSASPEYWRTNVLNRKALERLFIDNVERFEALDIEDDIKQEVREAFESFMLLE